MADLETRVAILEVERDYLKETRGIVLELKERLDKQNGLIPHMAEDLKEVRSKVESMGERFVGVEKEQLKLTWGQKAIIGAFGLLGGGVGASAVKLLQQLLG